MRRPVKADLMPWFARALSSSYRHTLQRTIFNTRARLRGESDLVRVFVNPRDPFGLPLLQALVQLQEHFRVRIRLHTVWQLDDEMYPEPALWGSWAQQDATLIAKLYNFTPPDRPTPLSETELKSATARLLHAEQANDGLNSGATLYTRTWADLTSAATRLPDGHPAAETALEVFFSIRSPYSYLGLERVIQLAEAWNIPLQLRPVLPMVMRGQSVPGAKKWYIFHDTKREADKLGIPYGFVADPLGPGVERCYALFEYARSLGREIEYMRSYARAVNAEGIRSETDAGLKVIVERAGLEWQKAKTLLNDQSWREWAEVNRKAMYDCGLWGVPSFRYGTISCWGQDRLWIIEEAIKKRVETSSTQGVFDPTNNAEVT